MTKLVALVLSSFFLKKTKQKNRRGSRIAIAYEGVRHDNVYNMTRLSPCL